MSLDQLPLEIIESVVSHIKDNYESYFALRNSCHALQVLNQADYFQCLEYSRFHSCLEDMCELHYGDGVILDVNELHYFDAYANADELFARLSELPLQIQREVLKQFGRLFILFVGHLKICTETYANALALLQYCSHGNDRLMRDLAAIGV